MLELSHVNAFYGQSHILHDVSFSMAEGARMAILGRNGAGKSTLLKSIMNAGPRVEGAIRFRDRPLEGTAVDQRARLGLSLVPEERRIFGHLSSYENLKIARYGAASEREPIDVDALIGRFPMLVPLRDRPGSQMSGGQQQMLAVAQGIVKRPKLMMLDEPSAGLSPVLVDRVLDVVGRLRQSGVAVLLVEQIIEKTLAVSDRVYALSEGRIVLETAANTPGLPQRLEQAYFGAVA